MKTELARYAACRALAEARSVDEVREILNLSEAQRAYAKMAKNREADAFEIRKRAERCLGKMMEAQRKTIGLARPGGDTRPEHRVAKKPDAVPTLAEAGIDKNLAHRARTAAGVPAKEFERIIAEGRERITTASDRVTIKLLKACAPTRQANNKQSDRSLLEAVDDKGTPSTHAECVNLADLRSCWDDNRVAGAVRRVIGEALQGSDAPNLPSPSKQESF